jgi:hypothetical protein
MIRMSTGTRALLLVVGMLLAPPEAYAQGVHGSVDTRMPGGSVSHSFPSPPPMIRPPMQPVAPAPAAPPQGFPSPNQGPFRGRSHDRFPFRGPATIDSPSVVYYGVPYAVPYAVLGPSDYGSAPYYDPTASYDPYSAYGAPSGDVSTLAPDASSTPGVIQYPTGRYELRGDGVAAPHQWVWIPNPPPAPPTAPPESSAISPSPAPPAPPARHVTVYRWVDGEGVVHFTDSLDAVPQEYRSQAKPAS